MERTIVIGHKNPDTDSICASVAYAELKSVQGYSGVFPARAGNINPQTGYVLERFGRPAPVFVADVYPRIADIMIADPVTVTRDTPILEVIRTFKEKGIRFLPVMDGRKVAGTYITLDLAERLTRIVDPGRARQVIASPEHIAACADARILTMPRETGERTRSVYVAAMSEESFGKKLEGLDPAGLIVITGDREEIIARAIGSGIALVMVTGGLPVPDRLVDEAKKAGTGIMVSPHDSASTAWLVKLATAAVHGAQSRYVSLSPREKISDARAGFIDAGERGGIVEDDEGNFLGVVTRSCFMKRGGVRLILVDHNELSQAVDGAGEVEIVEVVDHHRVCGLETALPISFIIEPVGSTCTIVAARYRDGRHDLSSSTAGLLLSGIISDTVAGKSPTTTNRDREFLGWLAGVAGVDVDEHAAAMFAASSDLHRKSPAEIIGADFKEFDIQGRKVGVGQVEVVGFTAFNRARDGILGELASLRERGGYDLAGLMVTDISTAVTLFPVAASREVLARLGLPEREKNVFEMKDVLSRKKQVVPHLYNVLR